MSSAVVLSQPTKADVFIGQVLPPDRMAAVLESLPDHVKPERFKRNLVVAVTQHPQLLECDPVAVFNEVSKAAALGLYMDPQLGEAYLITGFSNGRRVPQLRLGYRGLIKLARQSGQIATVYAHEVCANDKFKMTLGTTKLIEHEPDLMGDRGEIGLYYAVVKFADGDTDFEPMSIKDIHRIRDRSDGWKAYKAGKIKSTPWATDEGEMSKKVVLRRLLKRIPQSPEIADALRIEDEDYRDAPELPQRQPLSARLNGTQTGDGFSQAHVEEQLLIESNSSQAASPAQSETDTPAVSDPAVLYTAGNLSSSSDVASGDVEGAQAGGGSSAAGLPSTLPPDWQSIYITAMSRVTERPKSLPNRHNEALTMFGSEPNDDEFKWITTVYQITEDRLHGKIKKAEADKLIAEITDQ